MEGDTKHMSSLLADLWTSCKTEEREQYKLYETKLNIINNFQNCERSLTTEYCQTMLFESAVNDESRVQFVKLENRWPLVCTLAEVYSNDPGSKPTDSAEFQAEKPELSAFKEEDGAESKDTNVECTTWTLQLSGKLERLKEEAVANVHVDALTPGIDDQRTGFLAEKEEENVAVFEICREVGTSPSVHLSSQEESVCGNKKKGRERISAKAIHRCELCPKAFPSVSTLQSHTRVHTGEKPFSCQLCQKKFPSMGQLKRHMRVHTGEKPFPCEVCKKSFSNKDHIKKHMAIHTGVRNYACQLCHKKFKSMDHIRAHMLVHTGEKPFKCEICDKSFGTSSNRNSHMIVHTGERNHACSICPKTYPRAKQLKVHMHVHSEMRPYVCRMCPKGFRYSSSRQRHELTHIG